MSRLDHYAEWLIANQNLKGTPNFEAVASAYRDLRATPEEPEEMPAPQMQPQPEETPEPQGQLGAAAKRGVHALSEQAAGIGLGLESAFGKQEAAQKQMEAIKADQAKSAQGVKSTQFKDIEDIYGKEGLIAAAKEVPGYIAEKALESAPSAAAPLGVGLAAASVTGPVGGAIAGATTAVVQMFGEMMQRQAQEKHNAGELEPGKAAGAAVPAGLLDYAVDRVTLGMANPFKQAVKEAAEQEIKKSVLGAVAKRAAISAPLGAATEIGQQALELTQAGLPIADEAAKQEYKEAGIAGGLLEGLAGGAGAAYRTQAQNQEVTATEETRSPQPEAAAEEPISQPEPIAQDETEITTEVPSYDRGTIETGNAPEVATEEPISQPEPIAQDETEITTEVPSYDRGTIETGNAPEVKPSETPTAVSNKEEVTAVEDGTFKGQTELNLKPIPTKEGASPIVEYGERKIVMADVNGVSVPFYLSTGYGGKKNVASGKWYPMFGIGEKGWINKTSGSDMNTYYGSPELAAVAKQLDTQIGDVRNDTSHPVITPYKAFQTKHDKGAIDFINSPFSNKPAASHDDPDVISTVNKNIEAIKQAIGNKQTGVITPNKAEGKPVQQDIETDEIESIPEQKVLNEQPDAIKEFVGRETQHTALKTKPSVIKDTIEAFKNFDADRAAQMLVRPAAPVSTELKERGIFEDDKLRGDSIIHANKQIGNVIQAASESGPAVPAGDGTLKASVNPRLAPINIFRNVVDTGKKYGFDGAQQLAEAYRISWGEETLAEDAKMKAKAQELKTQAKDYEDIANDMAKKGNAKVNEITAAKAKAQALKNKADALEDIYRERTVTPEDIKKKDAFLKAAPEMKQHIQDLRDLIRANVDLWYETGRIDKETRDQWNSKKYYMPMQVFSEAKGTFDDVPESWGVGAGARSVAGMEKRKGHSQAVNLWDNLQKQQAFMTAIAGQNLARNEALTQLEKYGSAKKAADQSDSNKKGNYVVSYVDGKKTWWEVKNPALVDAFQNFNYQLSPLMKIAQKGAQVLRTTALVQPYYWYKQLVIDPIHASFVGGVGNLTPLHSFTEFAKILTNTSKAVPVLRRHGVIGPVDVIHDADAVKDQIGYAMQAKPISVSKLAHALTKIHEAADASTRAAAYNKALAMAKQQGLTGDAAENFAVNKARELINFSVHGISSSVNTMRNMVPFFSAALNSLDTTYRAATGHNLNAKEAAKARADFRNATALTFTLTSIYTLMMLQDQDYLDAKGIDKDGNWLVPLPDDENGRHGFLKIPAPHEIGFLFKTLPELLIRGMMNDATTKEILTSIGEGISRNTPPLMPMAQIVKPTVDVTRNYNALTGAPIESTGQQRLPVERRGEASASEIAKFASDDLKAKNINLSPAKIDYLIRGYFAEWGAMGSALADSMIRTYKGEDKTPTKDWLNSKENPMRSMFTNPISSRSKAQLYELFESSQQIVNSVTDYQKQGNVEKIKELMADPETKKQYATAAGMKAFIDKEAEFNRQIKIISSRPDTPANRALIKSLQRKSNDNASKAIAVAKKLGLPY